MHTQARYFIRTALLYLLSGFLIGGLVLVNQTLMIDSRISAFQPVFYHLLTVGWITQLIFGVALWMFPPLSREQPRGNEQLGWFTYGALNAGLLLRAFAEPLYTWQPGIGPGAALGLAAGLQAAAAWAFVIAIWPRVKGRPAGLKRGS